MGDYSDGTSSEVTEFTLSGNAVSLGDNTYTVVYKNVTTTFIVTGVNAIYSSTKLIMGTLTTNSLSDNGDGTLTLNESSSDSAYAAPIIMKGDDYVTSVIFNTALPTSTSCQFIINGYNPSTTEFCSIATINKGTATGSYAFKFKATGAAGGNIASSCTFSSQSIVIGTSIYKSYIDGNDLVVSVNGIEASRWTGGATEGFIPVFGIVVQNASTAGNASSEFTDFVIKDTDWEG